jgi:hypothetical protein
VLIAGLPTCVLRIGRLPSQPFLKDKACRNRGFDQPNIGKPAGAFVPAYRCGAVPDVRRIPFSGERTALTTRSKIDYIVSPMVGQRLYVVVFVEM